MKILLITNSLQPAASNYIGEKKSVRGGWVYSSAKRIALVPENTVCIASIHEHGKEFVKFEEDNILYYILPTKDRNNYDKEMESYWKKIHSEFQPDITHIYGTEYPLSLSYVRACGSKGVVVSIQGMVGQYEKYYYGGLTFGEMISNISLKEILLKSTLFNNKSHFHDRGKFEDELLKKVKFIEGRTSWDKENCWAINPSLKYYQCYRTLRDSFYKNKWNYENIEKYSIFLSQGRSPLKGMHMVLKALYIVKRHYPEVKLYVTNNLNFNDSLLKKKWSGNTYNNYLIELIRKLDLVDNVQFTGFLDEEEMCERYLKSHLFICPSSIENSPNSVGEAQILGVPCIGSYVGGTMDMIEDGKTGFLYRYEEINMLACKICKVFGMSKDNLLKLSHMEIETAKLRHSIDFNTKKMIEIYGEIYQEEYCKQ